MQRNKLNSIKVTLLGVTFLWAAVGIAAESLRSDWAAGWLVRNILVRDFSAQRTLIEDKNIQDFIKSKKGQASLARMTIVLSSSEPDFMASLPEDVVQPYKAFSEHKANKDSDALYNLAFEDAKVRENIQSLLGSATHKECKVSPLELRQYIEHQKSVIKETQHAYSSDLIKYVKLWKVERIKCLIINLAKKYSIDSEYDYLALTATLSQFGYAQDPFFKKMLATRYLIENNYAESLRNLYELQSLDPRFRNLYEIVQRQYSFVQKGQGEVSIKSL